MDTDEFVDAYDSFLVETADRIYAARRAFLREHFESYVADTYYYVPDDSYYCWPVHSAGSFEGFTDLTAVETDVTAALASSGFDLLGVGAGRVVCSVPDAVESDIVVKFGRCGMGETYGAGRRNNLTERTISSSTTDVPVVPCRYCDPLGRYALYPTADPVDERDLSTAERADLKAAVERELTGFRTSELDDIDNLARLDGDLRIVDYAAFDTVPKPLGVPDHVDTVALLSAVDARRRRGEKLDIAKPGELVTPDL